MVFEEELGDKELTEAVRGRLRRLVGDANAVDSAFFAQLLRKKRVMVIVSCLVILMITIPFIYAFQEGSAEYGFGGFLINPTDGHSYLAKIQRNQAKAPIYSFCILDWGILPGSSVFRCLRFSILRVLLAPYSCSGF